MTIDNVEFRVSDDDAQTIEAGLFAGEDCVDVVALTKDEAIATAATLLQSLAAIGTDRLDIHNAFEAALIDAPKPAPAELQPTGKLWDLFEAGYGLCIQRDDNPDDGRAPLDDDNQALELCISEAKAGDARAIEALAEIARVYHADCLHDPD